MDGSQATPVVRSHPPIDSSILRLSENIYLLGSSVSQCGAIATLRHAAKAKLEKSKSGPQGARKALLAITYAAGLATLDGQQQDLSVNVHFEGVVASRLG